MPLTEYEQNVPFVGEASDTASTSTTSTTYVALSNITETVLTPGKYLVMFSASGACSSATANARYGIALDGTVIANSERSMNDTGGAATASMFTAMHSQAIVTTTAANQVVTVIYKTEAGTFTVRERHMIVIGPLVVV